MDLAASQKISKEIAALTNKVEAFDKAAKTVNEAEEIVDLAEAENDESVLTELAAELSEAEKAIEEMRLSALLSGKYDRQNARDHHKRYVKSDFHITELDLREDFADCKHYALACQHDNTCFDFEAHSHSHQNDADHTDDPLLPVCMAYDPLYRPYAEIGQISEKEGYRELHQLDRMIIFPQDQDLQKNKYTVHDDRGCSDCKRCKQTRHIRYTGDRRSSEIRFNRKRDAERHDRKSGKKKQITL